MELAMENEFNKLIEICHENLKKTDLAKEYILGERKLSKASVVKHKIGFFPRNTEMLSKHVSPAFLKSIGLMDYDGTSQFSNYYSIVFPIYDDYGEPVAIAGRSMLTDYERSVIGIPKYKNSRFKKAGYLFGMDLARKSMLKKQHAFIVEGYMDQISMTSAGIENTVACCGTGLSRQHLIKLLRYTDKFSILLDNDDAGIKSAESIYNKYANRDLKLRFVKLPSQYKDAGEYFLDNNKTINDFHDELVEIRFGDWL